MLLCAACICATPMVQAETIVKREKESSTARGLDTDPTFYVRPVVADVIVDSSVGRIRETWTLTTQDLVGRLGDNDNATTANLRAYAMYKSAERHNCDIIVSPTFDVKFGSDGASITIVGYCANFANFSVGTNDDLQWILSTKYTKGEVIQGVQKVK